ncbi:hypothetical protein ACG904_09560 [Acinetobacter guillouiae]|uniref:hypothetical protein n=1 Tax=Acinetobacter guillouiae TaxID=106649 RepID=UPI003AF9A592
MTTINNLTIEQMREIVDGAPEWASHIRRGIYFKYRNPVEWHYWEENQWKFTSSDITKSVFLIDLNDLRTAISEHDREFKVGDLVVIKANPFWPEDYFIQQVEPENIGKWYMNAWRHATPSEIKAGHRLEAERHG